MALREIPFRIENKHGDPVQGDVRFVEADEPLPVVVMCHGFKGFKDWGPFPRWGQRLAEEGFASVLFNFSHNGVSPDRPTEFTELDAFADNTHTLELDDLEAVVDAVADGGLVGAPIDASRLGLMGHSRGGGTAILHAAGNRRVKALVTWSAVSGFLDRFSPEQIEEWEAHGYTEILNTRTGQQMRLNRVLYDDAKANQERLNIRRAAAQVVVPWLLVHAPRDEAVSFAEAKELAAEQPDAELFRAGGGHTFGGAHPFDGEVPETLADVWERTLAFFKEHL